MIKVSLNYTVPSAESKFLERLPYTMSPPTTNSRPSSSEACDRFLSIAELLNIFFVQCSPRVLLNCTLVCRTWSRLIRETTLLREHLFLQPIEARDGLIPVLNPMLSYFAPVLVAKSPSEEPSSNDEFVHTDALTSVPWNLDAQSRAAFAHPSASWRDMFISQPPISRLDWWHEWMHDEDASATKPPIFSHDSDSYGGWGHQDLDDSEPVTLGMLWDLVEVRLVRHCDVLVQYFPQGMPVEDDAHAHDEEKLWIDEDVARRRPYSHTEPRIVVRTRQAWTGVVMKGAVFDVEARQWVLSPENPRYTHAGDGFDTLRQDCQDDYTRAPRWSQSLGSWYVNLKGESSGRG
jgi:hypothetical protein